MITLFRRVLHWISGQLVGYGPAHNHDEGMWRADCPNCGLPNFQRWK